MKTSYANLRPLTCAFVLVLLLGARSSPAALLVDLNAQGGPLQSGGYVSWDPSHTDGAALNQSMSFAVAALSTDGTVDVTMTTGGSTFERNYPAITGGSVINQSNLLKDIVFFNNSLGGTNFYEVRFDDLKAGRYAYRAFHVATANVAGDAQVDILLNGIDTGQNVTLLNNSPWDAPVEARASVVVFSVASDNDPVTIRYANPTQHHFGLNGFELATDLKVDINGLGGPTASGWVGWDPVNPNNTALNTGVGTFVVPFATDGTVDVRLTTSGNTFERNYGVDNVTGTFSPETPQELWQDQYFHNNTAGAPFTISFDDLESGRYSLSLYSYFDNVNTNNHSANGTALADIFVNGVDSGIDAIAYGGNDVAYSAAFLEAMVTTIAFTVANDNDNITIEFRNPTADHFGLNGFQLQQVPEPSTIVLAGIMAMCLGSFAVYRARRKSLSKRGFAL